LRTKEKLAIEPKFYVHFKHKCIHKVLMRENKKAKVNISQPCLFDAMWDQVQEPVRGISFLY
jgi:hypothetical protein